MKHLYCAAAAIALFGIAACQPHAVTTSPGPVSSGGSARAIPHADYPAPASGSLQMILVVTDDWDAVPGVMRRFQRDGVRAAWQTGQPTRGMSATIKWRQYVESATTGRAGLSIEALAARGCG
jgi:hypothetical protein